VTGEEESKLLDGLRANDPGAQKFFWSIYYNQILGYVQTSLAKGHSKEDSEEIANEAFRRIFRDIQSFRGSSSLKTWVFAIVRHAATDHYRSKKNKYTTHAPEKFTAFSEEVVSNKINEGNLGEVVLDDLERKEQFSNALSLLDELETQQVQTVSLRILQGMSVKETSDVLGISESAVKMTLYRALLKLKEIAASRRDLDDTTSTQGGK